MSKDLFFLSCVTTISSSCVGLWYLERDGMSSAGVTAAQRGRPDAWNLNGWGNLPAVNTQRVFLGFMMTVTALICL